MSPRSGQPFGACGLGRLRRSERYGVVEHGGVGLFERLFGADLHRAAEHVLECCFEACDVEQGRPEREAAQEIAVAVGPVGAACHRADERDRGHVVLMCESSDGCAVAAEYLVSAGHARIVTTAPAELAGAAGLVRSGKRLGVV